MNQETGRGLGTQNEIRDFLFVRGVNVADLEFLSGGYTSTVFRGEHDGQPIIIKHARNRERFYPVKSFDTQTRMKTEVEVLKRLHPLFPTYVPEVLGYYPEQSVMLMSDVGQDAQLGFYYFLEHKAEPAHAHALGRFLGELKEATADWELFETVEDPFEQAWTRGLEVEVANPTWGEQMRTYYLGQKKFLWPDGHPKNILFGNSGACIRAIDFDCSHFADPDYMLPNFFGQVPVFTIMGHLTRDQGFEFVRQMLIGYLEASQITPEVEKKMCFYAGTQTIQRQDGKWLFGACGGTDDESLRRKANIFYFGRKVIASIDNFADYLQFLQESGS